MSVYESRMTAHTRHRPSLPFAAAALALLVAAAGLGGCAGMSDSMSTAFADPAKYELYDCKQLETARKALAVRAADLQGLMAKAETGAAGTVVAELAYRNEYIAVRGQTKFAEEAWQRNRARPPRRLPPRRCRRSSRRRRSARRAEAADPCVAANAPRNREGVFADTPATVMRPRRRTGAAMTCSLRTSRPIPHTRQS